MKRRIILLLIQFINITVCHSQNCIQGMDVFSRLLSPEKLYIHTDREVYNQGDTIWFAGYLKNASAYSEYPECNYIYVELMAPKYEYNIYRGTRSEVIRTKARVKIKRNENGHFSGYIPLSDDYNSSIAILRAYSYWMLNFNPAFMFSKNIEIINPMKDVFVKTLKETQMTDQGIYDYIGVRNPFRKNISSFKTNIESGIKVNFFPEGGNYICGMPSIIGIKAINSEGRGIKVSGNIIADDNVISSFETDIYGYGKTIVTIPDGTKKLKAAGESFIDNFLFESDLDIPSDNGAALCISPGVESADIICKYKKEKTVDSTFLIIYNKTGIETCSIITHNGQTYKASYDSLSSGINIAAIIDTDGNVHSQRAFFIFPQKKINVDIKFDKDRYEAHEKARLNITLTDKEGSAISGLVSVSITDESYAPFSQECYNLEAYDLLCGEFQEHVQYSSRYFNDSISISKRISEIDLLMLSYKCDYYDLEKILKCRTITPRYGKEYTQSLSGYVNGVLGKSKKSTICFAAPSIDYYQIEDLDSSAYFVLNYLDFPEGTQFIVGAQGRGRLFNKWYTPILNPEYFAAEHTYPVYLRQREYDEAYAEEISKSYYYRDGTITYTLNPSRIVANKDISPYPGDTFKQGEYRDENQLLAYKNLDVFTYIYTTCPGVRNINGILSCRTIGTGSNMSMGSRWQNINIYVNGFHSDQSQLNGIMVSDLDAFACVSGASASKYETISANPEIYLKPRITVLIKTKWPVHQAYNITSGKPLGWQHPASFPHQSYPLECLPDRYEPIRPTLYWNPECSIVDGKAVCEFYTSSHKASLCAVVEGYTITGEIIQEKITLKNE